VLRAMSQLGKNEIPAESYVPKKSQPVYHVN